MVSPKCLNACARNGASRSRSANGSASISTAPVPSSLVITIFGFEVTTSEVPSTSANSKSLPGDDATEHTLKLCLVPAQSLLEQVSAVSRKLQNLFFEPLLPHLGAEACLKTVVI